MASRSPALHRALPFAIVLIALASACNSHTKSSVHQQHDAGGSMPQDSGPMDGSASDAGASDASADATPPGDAGVDASWVSIEALDPHCVRFCQFDTRWQGEFHLLRQQRLIEVVGTLAYAVTDRLNILDIADPSEPKLLGSTPPVPEGISAMYVRDGTVLLVHGKQATAFDVRQPSAIQELAKIDFPGWAARTHMVDDVLFVLAANDSKVGFFSVASFRLDATSITAVSKLDYADGSDLYGDPVIGDVLFSAPYLFVVVPTIDGVTSTLEVVDISDATGIMKPGTSITDPGIIDGQDELDVSDGVLRVLTHVSTAGLVHWTLKTFTLTSPSQVTPLGSMELPHSPHQVLFAGPRLFVTYEASQSSNGDSAPLFAIDLSDAANPKQGGELTFPGTRYGEQVVGDRLISLTQTSDDTQGSLQVSVFDISNMAEPKQLATSEFGGPHAMALEGEGLQVFPQADRTLVVASFSLMAQSDDICWSTTDTHAQLFALTNDQPTPYATITEPRSTPAFSLSGTTLLALDAQHLRIHDIADLSTPALASDVSLPHALHHQVQLENGYTFGTTDTTYGYNPVASVISAPLQQSVAELDFNAIFAPNQCVSAFTDYGVFAHENYAELVYRRRLVGNSERDVQGVATFDLTNPMTPRLASYVDRIADFPEQDRVYLYGYLRDNSTFVRSANALLMMEHVLTANMTGNDEVRVVDMRDPNALSQVALVFPRYPYIGERCAFKAYGDLAVWSHFFENAPDADHQWQLERLDVSNPAQPEHLQPLDVPGMLLDYDPTRNRAITVGLRPVQEVVANEDDCPAHFPGYQYKGNGVCQGFVQQLHLLSLVNDAVKLVATHELPKYLRIESYSVAAERLHAELSTMCIGTGCPAARSITLSIDATGFTEVAAP